MIDGVIIKPLTQIPDNRGKVMHFLREDDPEFERFGEIYFSVVYPGVFKGWHRHTKMTLNYCVVSGMIKLRLFDARKNSPTYGEQQNIYMGEDNYCMVKIPFNISNGFMGLGIKPAIVANCATLPYNENEIIRTDSLSENINYSIGI